VNVNLLYIYSKKHDGGTVTVMIHYNQMKSYRNQLYENEQKIHGVEHRISKHLCLTFLPFTSLHLHKSQGQDKA